MEGLKCFSLTSSPEALEKLEIKVEKVTNLTCDSVSSLVKSVAFPVRDSFPSREVPDPCTGPGVLPHGQQDQQHGGRNPDTGLAIVAVTKPRDHVNRDKTQTLPPPSPSAKATPASQQQKKPKDLRELETC